GGAGAGAAIGLGAVGPALLIPQTRWPRSSFLSAPPPSHVPPNTPSPPPRHCTCVQLSRTILCSVRGTKPKKNATRLLTRDEAPTSSVLGMIDADVKYYF